MSNTTVYRELRTFLPAIWKVTGVTSGQAGIPMDMAGIGPDWLPLPAKCSVVWVGILLSEPLTAGLLRFEATKGGVGTGETFDMRPAQGTEQLWEFDPGELVVDKGVKIGFLWGTNAAMAPGGVIEANLYVAVQWA